VAESPLAIAVAARSFPGEAVSGDAWHVDWDGDTCCIAMIDGLGHGPQAATAAAAAISSLAARPAREFGTAIQECHETLKGTRGAALLMIRIAMAAGVLTFAGVGNVEAQLWQSGRTQHLVSDRGIVGGTLPRIRPVTISLEAEWLLLMYTDGIRDRFDLPTLQQSAADADTLAHLLLNDWSRPTDDATVLVAQPR
jgi:serine phosphatase RsbU (regulator of sigma subunit)